MITPQFIVVYCKTKTNLLTLVGKEVRDNVSMLFKNCCRRPVSGSGYEVLTIQTKACLPAGRFGVV